jgi:hypothetical protein
MSNDGGPAFPGDATPSGEFAAGMTLRDYFAEQALAGLLANTIYYDRNESVGFVPDAMAQDAYEIADAILRERAQ